MLKLSARTPTPTSESPSSSSTSRTPAFEAWRQGHHRTKDTLVNALQRSAQQQPKNVALNTRSIHRSLALFLRSRSYPRVAFCRDFGAETLT